MSHVYAYMTPEQQRERDERDLRILRMHENNMSVREISQRLGLHEQTIFKFLREMREYL